jgi:methyltransferase
VAKALKFWAIQSLGRFWTFRVLVVPGAPLVTSGPYRYMRHPNYVAVAGEIVGVAVMCGAPILGALCLLVFGALMLRRVAVEERALRSVSSRADL